MSIEIFNFPYKDASIRLYKLPYIHQNLLSEKKIVCTSDRSYLILIMLIYSSRVDDKWEQIKKNSFAYHIDQYLNICFTM